MSAISTITSGELNYNTIRLQNNTDDSIIRNVDFKNDSLDDSLSNQMDGKRMRKAVFRRTIDYNSSVALFIEQRTWKRKYSPRSAIQPDVMYQHLLTPPTDYRDNPMNCVCAKHVRTSTNKNKCPIYAVCWTPDGRRLITGASSGEFTLWNGLTFNFETILQAHDTHIRAMKWSNNEEWLVSADDSGFVKYWQANMNDVNVFQAHKDSVRGVSFCPSDKKFVTCSNDNTVRIWDFQTYKEERVLRGHGGEVRCVAWHPTKSLLLSGSKDSQQPLKLWDPKTGECISTMYVHKSTCTDIGINKNGNWFLTASKDHYIKLFDLRNLKTEMQVFRGHKKDVIRVAWHPYHETLFASGSGDGALLYWLVGTDMEVGAVEDAHDNIIWSLDWHPMGHILASGSNDFATKFWTRNRPGDVLKDNLQEDKIIAIKPEVSSNPDTELENMMKQSENEKVFEFDIHKLSSTIAAEIDKSEKSDIPGLLEGLNSVDHDNSSTEEDFDDKESKLKGAVSRTIPKQFSANWANKKSTPVVYAANEAANPMFVNPQSIIPAIAPMIALPPPIVHPGIFPPNPIAPQNRMPQHEIPFKMPFKEEPAPVIVEENPSFRMVRPVMHNQRNFWPRNQNMAPIRGGGSGGGSDQFSNFPAPQLQQQQQHHPQHHQQQQQQHQPPPFRPFMDFRSGEGGGYHHQQHHQMNNFENHEQNFHPHPPPPQIHGNSNNNIQNFPNYQRGDFNQNRHPPMRPFRPDFGHHHQNDHPHRGGSEMMRPRFQMNDNNNRRDNHRFHHPPNNVQTNQQRHHHYNQHHHQPHHHQQHDEMENPFEPSKYTGSSKTFIPLSQKYDDLQHKRGNNNRFGNRPDSHW